MDIRHKIKDRSQNSLLVRTRPDFLLPIVSRPLRRTAHD